MTKITYDYHVFCCTNKRPDGHERGCCASKDAEKIRNYMKARVKELKIPSTRINTAGCLDRCEEGPVVVIYPEGIWYKISTTKDADEVIESHLQNKKPVARLFLNK